jgi:hypothetical protein
MVLDDSSSMNLAAGARSKWATVQSALVAFVMDPASSGLGVGLSFFPNRPPTKVCTGDADCGVNDCVESDYCLGGQELASYPASRAASRPLSAGGHLHPGRPVRDQQAGVSAPRRPLLRNAQRTFASARRASVPPAARTAAS